jgi:two-component system sensor histidine kinase KdpD
VTAGAIIDAAVAHVASALRLRRVLVDADDSFEVQVDPRLTSVALAHLLENAARYSPPDSSIEVRAEASTDTIRISVTDDGPGIEPQEFERLFEPFVRGRAGLRQRPGTGLGLAITRGLLAAEDGQVWAENVPGRGARFTISVPGPRRSVNLAEPQS